jgi:hypothetical protein
VYFWGFYLENLLEKDEKKKNKLGGFLYKDKNVNKYISMVKILTVCEEKVLFTVLVNNSPPHNYGEKGHEKLPHISWN